MSAVERIYCCRADQICCETGGFVWILGSDRLVSAIFPNFVSLKLQL